MADQVLVNSGASVVSGTNPAAIDAASTPLQ